VQQHYKKTSGPQSIKTSRLNYGPWTKFVFNNMVLVAACGCRQRLGTR
jgi:hypothetical protein